MNYPISPDELSATVDSLLSSDDLCAGRVPGFAVLSRLPASGDISISEKKNASLTVGGDDPLAFDSLADCISYHDKDSTYVRAIAGAILESAQPTDDLLTNTWNYRLLSAQVGPHIAVIFPWWRGASESLPSLDRPALSSRSVNPDEVIFVLRGSGEYVIERRAAIESHGTTSTLTFPSQVYRVPGSTRPIVTKLRLLDPSSVSIPPNPGWS